MDPMVAIQGLQRMVPPSVITRHCSMVSPSGNVPETIGKLTSRRIFIRESRFESSKIGSPGRLVLISLRRIDEFGKLDNGRAAHHGKHLGGDVGKKRQTTSASVGNIRVPLCYRTSACLKSCCHETKWTMFHPFFGCKALNDRRIAGK